jgi:glycerate kinase
MRVVVAPDKFKGSLTAAEVAEAVASGIRSVRPGTEIVIFPVADGGDGTVAAALSAGFDEITVTAPGPTLVDHPCSYAWRDGQAVIELAAVVGLDLLPGGRLQPLDSSTFGLGVVIADAIERGATEILIGLGGSASTDGGAGMLQAMGGRLLDADGAELAAGGGQLARLAALDLRPVRDLVSGVSFRVASDVDNPLLGPRGAAAVFGPQKGADPELIGRLETGLRVWADRVASAVGADQADRPGAGAAGGTGFAAMAVLDADLAPGIELVLDLLDFPTALRGADLVITGEGSLDEQSLAGKAPIGVAQAATGADVRVVAVAGRCLLPPGRLAAAHLAQVYTLATLEPDLHRSIAQAATLLQTLGRTIAEEWLG